MSSEIPTRPGRGRRLARASRRLASTDVQMQLAVLAVDRWNRLAPDEQLRFRALAPRAGRLDPIDEKELRKLWARLEVKRLVATAIQVLTSDRVPR